MAAGWSDGEGPELKMHHPQRWIAFLRIAVGVWFLKSLFTKLRWTALGLLVATPRWTGFLPGRLQEYAAANPLPWYRANFCLRWRFRMRHSSRT